MNSLRHPMELLIEKSKLYANGIILRDPKTKEAVFTGTRPDAIRWCFSHNLWFNVREFTFRGV